VVLIVDFQFTLLWIEPLTLSVESEDFAERFISHVAILSLSKPAGIPWLGRSYFSGTRCQMPTVSFKLAFPLAVYCMRFNEIQFFTLLINPKLL